jgi:oxygen-independent coproporphyrinogen-3 oxidase
MEIELKRNILENYEIGSIYVGGGTPTCIPDCLLDKLLKHLSEFANNIEFTVEAGRPDSISLKNLNIMANNKVSRISINPQTFNEDTLIKIGRNHNVDSIYEAYELSRLFSFCINMDLIAGLPDEHEKDFISSLNKTIALSPDNITVHSLSIKRGSIFMEEANKKDVSGVVTKMVDYSQSTLVENGYIPYYLYRQKNTFDNLENVGYCKPGKQCRYNINYMEETNTVLGLGAGAMTKFVFNKENRIERVRNKKNIELYMTDIINLAKH